MRVKNKKIIILSIVIFTFLFSTVVYAARNNFHWEGTIYHYNIGTGITNTQYSYNVDIDTSIVSWDTSRSQITYSGFTAFYYTPRFMDPNISYSFHAAFTYRKDSSSGSELGSIFTWPYGNKYSYIGPGSPWRVATGGNYTNFINDPNKNFI